MAEYLEREDKYDVDADFAVPDLTAVVAGTHGEAVHVRLENTYFDTADGALRARGLLLRRRIGGSDEGWQLKVPEGNARVELQEPLGDGEQIPAALLDVVEGVRLRQPLEPVVRMTTERGIDRILGADGDLLLEVADDRVEAEDLRSGGASLRWREVEVELAAAAPTVLDDVRESMLAAGAEVSSASSKLVKVLGSTNGSFDGARAARALAEYISTQAEEILRGDVALRRGIDPIHKTRVAIRRLRSTMRVFGDLLDAPADFEQELKLFAGLLGEVRDRQVQRAHFADDIAALPPEHVLGSVAADLDAHLLGEQLRAREVVTKAMTTARYTALLEVVTAWAAQPPIAAGVGGKKLRAAVSKATRKADKRLAAALKSDDDEALHSARKSAKRARYAAELGDGLLGNKKAKRLVKRYKKIQTHLGDHQDSVVAAETLWRAATRSADAGGANGFTYGLLFAREQARADAAVAAVRRR
ncbi:CYTH and CHAD domain-containing protein [Aldersonia kunmingensis]|uniref:CYTH and CHAD domain-containing protein n=1 Tax=Aldersonia kunmingensis TaxID=408066 RepID=UPI0008317715|nr:CYTH and CHAD domain-containing protein [Aldersonia kunmingensis]